MIGRVKGVQQNVQLPDLECGEAFGCAPDSCSVFLLCQLNPSSFLTHVSEHRTFPLVLFQCFRRCHFRWSFVVSVCSPLHASSHSHPLPLLGEFCSVRDVHPHSCAICVLCPLASVRLKFSAATKNVTAAALHPLSKEKLRRSPSSRSPMVTW